jgi:hypothetical protein
MISMKQASGKAAIAWRIRNVRELWSSSQHHQRALEGQRQAGELARLIAQAIPEPEIWATGALTTADLQRLCG